METLNEKDISAIKTAIETLKNCEDILDTLYEKLHTKSDRDVYNISIGLEISFAENHISSSISNLNRALRYNSSQKNKRGLKYGTITE